MCLCAIPIALQGSVADRTMSACPAKGAEPNGEAPKRDSWVYDKEQGNLIRLHVCERKGFFNPNGVKECRVDLALFAPTRTTTMHTICGNSAKRFIAIGERTSYRERHGCPMDRTDGFQDTR